MIKVQTMIRAFLWVSVGVALSGAYAKADNFNFSITGSLGTVTGEIFGLTNDGLNHAATEVLILTYPASLDPFPTLDVTAWDTQVSNLFTEFAGSVTSAFFEATDGPTVGFYPDTYFFSLDTSLGEVESTSPPVREDIGPTIFTPAAVPEPNALVLLSTALLLVALVARKRIAHGR